MSTYGVRSRFIALLARSGGAVTDAAYADLIVYASERGFSSGELKALLRPADFIERSRVLRARGVRLADIRFDPAAWARAEVLAGEHGVAPIFDRLPNSRPTTAVPTPTPTPTPAGGRSLGSIASWQIDTPGATLRFSTAAAGDLYPALVLSVRQYQDPASKDVVAAHRAALLGVASLPAAIAAVRGILTAEATYFAADGVETTSALQRYGLQDLRRHTFFTGAQAALRDARLPAADRGRLGAALASEKERLLTDRDFTMEVGSHTNYWPYWKNFRRVVEKVLAQTAPGTDDFYQIKNRLHEIDDTKTVLGFRRSVDEKDLETSVGQAVVRRRLFEDGDGHRISLGRGSFATAPVYETLTLRDGSAVYRDGDALYHDRPGQAAVSPEDAKRVTARPVAADELGLRPLRDDEPARAGIAFDWNRDGGIATSPIDIGWWGHCHNEAPLNAMGVDPQRGVDLYRADRKVPAAAARTLYSAEDVWDAAGALASDHEAGYFVRERFTTPETQVDVTKFVGSRNDGGHWILLEPAQAGTRRVRIDAEVIEMWHKSNPTERYPDPAARFRRDLPDSDGGFAPNPDWVATASDDSDEITVDALGRKVTLQSSFVTFDARGQRYLAKERVALDPEADTFVKLADEILRTAGAVGGTVAEHWYNAKRGTYYQVTVEVSPGGRRETARTQPMTMAAVRLRQETVYDSVIDLHDFITKNMGLPFTCDTSSGMAVWNYPVNRVRIDRVREIERTESESSFTYTTYKLHFTTMGGPGGTPSYIIKRDGAGNAVRAVAENPMPDFAFRNEHWVCAPCAPDVDGTPAFNRSAMQGGYLVDKNGDKVVTGLWKRLVTLLYASLLGGRSVDPVRVFETADGDVRVFDDAAAFDLAIAADQAAGRSITR